MTPDEWQRVKTITAEALERPASDRAAFVAAECGSDDRLRDEVWSLLVASDKAAPLYEMPMFAVGNVQAAVTDLEQTAFPVIVSASDHTKSSASWGVEGWAVAVARAR